MSGAPTEADIGQSRGCISQIGIERAKTNKKNLTGDLFMGCVIPLDSLKHPPLRRRQIVQEWERYDNLGVLQQLGLAPEQ